MDKAIVSIALPQRERGSILVYVLLGIVLIAALTVAIRNTSTGGQSNLDREDAVLKFSQIQRHGSEFAAAVQDLLQSGLSEADIRFAHPDAPADYGTITTDPTHQIFGKTGAKAIYRTIPTGINDGSPWEFFATTQLIQAGSDRAELIAVLPNVTEDFCKVVNAQLGFHTNDPTDSATGTSPDCVKGGASDRFTGSFDDATPNLLDDTTFSHLPAPQACVYCASDSTYNYYYVLMTR